LALDFLDFCFLSSFLILYEAALQLLQSSNSLMEPAGIHPGFPFLC
jgi:hypothetical protein